MPSPNEAVKIIEPGFVQIVPVDYPTLPADDYIIVKTMAVGLNPTDWKHIDSTGVFSCVGCTVGCDYAGIVEKVGPGVVKRFKKGDRIAGVVNGSNTVGKSSGAFAKYIAVKGNLQFAIPDHISGVEAATQGVATLTIGQNLYQALKLRLPDKPTGQGDPFFLLIYGGSSCMGVVGIQYAKLSGATVVTTCSPKHSGYLKSLGADHVFDYKSPTLIEDILKLTNNTLKLAFDCIGEPATATTCAAVLAEENSRYTGLSPSVRHIVLASNPKIEVHTPLAYSATNEQWSGWGIHEPNLEDYNFAQIFVHLNESLLKRGRVRPPRTFVNCGGAGLQGVMNGLQMLKEGSVSGGKLVYTMAADGVGASQQSV
ncbi:Fc.00g069820.m01.CDS01 [Cosmosporella sp. VM-42]